MRALTAADRVNASCAAFRTPYVQLAGLEVDIVPTEGHGS